MRSKKEPNSVILILPSISAGGMERVMLQLAKEFVDFFELKVYLILLTQNKKFYKVPEKVKIIEPNFNYKNFSKLTAIFKTISFVRKSIKQINTNTVLSFGGKYNAFVILLCMGLGLKIYISDRSRPGISYGKFLDFINPIFYRKTTGIVAQTNVAKEFATQSTKHKNIRVIGNPIRNIESDPGVNKEKIILNVGRFIKSKHQEWLIEYFLELDLKDWKLILLGDGPLFDATRNLPKVKENSNKIIIKSHVKNIDHYYNKAEIFAFTSTSEGFPNALGEAMKAGLACISFNCKAGPSDIIDHGINGFLINVEDHEGYKQHLRKLCGDKALRKIFGMQAQTKMKKFDSLDIAQQYIGFLYGE